MKARRTWQGMMTIARFNWPFYVAALAVLAFSFVGLLSTMAITPKLIFGSALGGALYFLVGSLGVSHLVYDRSDLYRWRWLERALRGAIVRRAIFCHAGFDETSVELRARFAGADWTILDHFDERRMTEGSIRRARRMFPPTPDTLPAHYAQWPVAADSADVVFGLLAIHELRSEAERAGWFAEARRCLRRDGLVVLVEHVRDMANFLAFGPGFLHFHAPRSWRRAWTGAGLQAVDEFCVTAWVRVFVLTAS